MSSVSGLFLVKLLSALFKTAHEHGCVVWVIIPNYVTLRRIKQAQRGADSGVILP